MKVKEFLVKIKDNFLEELFPSNFTCYNCNDEIKDNNKYHICKKCLSGIEIIKNPCVKCGEDLNSFTKYCNNCKTYKRNFDKVVSVSKYDKTAKHLVHKLKYGKVEYIAESIVPFLVDLFNQTKFENIDVITCVPISKERLKDRGFNQAQILAEKLSNKINIIFDGNIIKRIVNTESQTHLTKIERANNLSKAFEVCDNKDLKGKNILIVDDVITTGATMNEIAKLLKNKGANKVYGITFCHS